MNRHPSEVLRERALALARPLTDRGDDERQEIMRWTRGGEGFALPLAALRAVGPIGRLAAVPWSTPPLAGMVAFRGGLLPAYDPVALLDAPDRSAGAASWALVADDEMPFALLADDPPQIETVRADDLRPAGLDLPEVARACLAGVDPRGWVLLDPEALRRDPRLLSSSPEQPHRRIETPAS